MNLPCNVSVSRAFFCRLILLVSLQVIARVAGLTRLNGSSISQSERKDAELQYLRQLTGKLLAFALSFRIQTPNLFADPVAAQAATPSRHSSLPPAWSSMQNCPAAMYAHSAVGHDADLH